VAGIGVKRILATQRRWLISANTGHLDIRIRWRKNRQLRAEFRGSAPDAGKIPGVLGMQNVLNGVSMAVGVMEKALYPSYTP
jgi:hypothetical protein